MQFHEIGKYIKEIQDGGKLAVITDENVAAMWLEACCMYLINEGFTVRTVVLPAGENSKTGEVYLKILDYLASIPLTRSDGIVALGGGMIGDLAGFCAATYLRGIKVIQVPTTLLAAVDSSIGGKTGIDLPAGKNLAGAFHQPALVVRDPRLLSTLPEDVFKDGMAEVIKTAVIADADLFEEVSDPELIEVGISDMIEKCAAIKTGFVEKDEFDNGVRKLLNFGHTIGHAIEKLSGYRVSHGRAVAMGMARIAEISAAKGWCPEEDKDKLIGVLKAHGFDLGIQYSGDELFGVIAHDKKRSDDTIDLVIMERIGSCAVRRMTMDELKELL